MNEDPLSGFHFALDIGGKLAGTFQTVEVQSLGAQGAAQPPFRRVPPPGSVSGLATPRPGAMPSSHSSVTLKRGIPLANSSAGAASGALKWRGQIPDRGPAEPGSGVGPRGDLTGSGGDATSATMPGRLKWQDISLKRAIGGATMGNPAAVKWQPVTLKRGMSSPAPSAPGPKQIQSRSTLDGLAHKIQPSILAFGGFVGSGEMIPDLESNQSGRIILVDANGRHVAQWNFQHAWPCKYSGPQVKSDSGETVFFVFEKLRRG